MTKLNFEHMRIGKVMGEVRDDVTSLGLTEWADVGNLRRHGMPVPPPGEVDTALDNLLCGVTTMRDRHGVVSSKMVEGFVEWEKELLQDQYTTEELWQSPVVDLQGLLTMVAPNGFLNGDCLRAVNAAQWRTLVRQGHWSVREMMEALVGSWLRAGHQSLPPFLSDAMRNQPTAVIKASVEFCNELDEPPF